MPKRSFRDKIAKFRRIESRDKWMLLHAVVWLFIARVLIAVVPFRYLAHWSSSKQDTPERRVPPELLQRIGYAVSAAGNNVPWRSDCFPRSIAACMLLKHHRYPSTIHLGIRKDTEAGIAGHAWLTSGDTVVTGGEGLDRYTEMHRLSA